MLIRRTVPALALALPLAVAGCSSSGDTTESSAVVITTPTAVPEQQFEANDVANLTTTEISGERVDDPGMNVSYKWQGTRSASNGGTIVVVAVTNQSDVPMPVSALAQPSLTYSTGSSGTNKEIAEPLSGEDAGVDTLGLDMPLGAGASVNLMYAFDVSMYSLYNAQFTIGNVVFSGNLNN
ncbi:hypothetical protein CAPI_03365 [Corynebacterium capitovis DSM 44611]|uniref:hypothetical protein n=1 Tax=Corynebacterium capitovis TaxID=131081 RepID=UPI00036719F4|nr:hypothetical protein [Corynebacterium capitovis]WKD57235.1 hypothetical protein CAPI_03365 [Corynebacterium capitovis DSM 44611]